MFLGPSIYLDGDKIIEMKDCKWFFCFSLKKVCLNQTLSLRKHQIAKMPGKRESPSSCTNYNISHRWKEIQEEPSEERLLLLSLSYAETRFGFGEM